MNRAKTTVLIVDDSALIREMFQDMLSSDPHIEVVGTASDPYDAREKIKRLNPDVLTLDIEMPKMDGLSFLEKIMTLRPMPVIMASTLTQTGSDIVLRALEIGAFDYVAKPFRHAGRSSIAELRDELVTKVLSAAGSNKHRHMAMARGHDAPVLARYNPRAGSARQLIAVGASTGGVEALREFFLRIPANAPPIVVTQHMPEAFTRSFAERLNALCEVNIAEAENHSRLKPGHALIAPGGRHLRVIRLGGDYVCKLDDDPPVSGHRPSVDVLFHSVATAAASRAVGVILTGMGKDGAEGLEAMRQQGAYTVGQNEASCVVYGMPQAARKIGATQIELPVEAIPQAVLSYCEKGVKPC